MAARARGSSKRSRRGSAGSSRASGPPCASRWATRRRGSTTWARRGSRTSVTALERNNYEVVSVDLTSPRPSRRLEDCRVVAIVGPEVPLAAAAARRVGAYLDQGGSLLVAASAMIDDEYRPVPSGLEPLATRAGVVLGNDTVVERAADARLPVRGGGALLRARRGARDHPRARQRRRGGLPSAGERVAEPRPGAVTAGGVATTVLLRSSEQASAVDDLRPFLDGRALTPRARDRRGPLPIAVAAELAPPAPPSRPRASRAVFLGTPTPPWRRASVIRPSAAPSSWWRARWRGSRRSRRWSTSRTSPPCRSASA
ncbi:MAG: Gldg family protein [Desulfobacterales bacterium]|nr:Gldg family protein [Desulfobacterales bacterium]